MAALRYSCKKLVLPFSSRLLSSGELGSGAGKGGGQGGSIRDAGGSFGKMEAAHEEQYFRKMEAELLAKIKREHQEQSLYHDEEIEFHKNAIKRHTEAIERHTLLKTQHDASVRDHEGSEKNLINMERTKKK
ncbi:ATPase inhibitor A, mitochondrial isoform X1 [Hydra vulgaris]|uniref:ATPase inhibitor A, mitochondrial isoform X1 n=1 Tax=Hydra vulgaris TaxID=6087 RepID=UPI0001924D80|nr:ATPase inhibitor A, mitochondrial [Hydra vulgaris]